MAAPIPGSRGRQIAESIRRFGFTVVLTALPSFATCFLASQITLRVSAVRASGPFAPARTLVIGAPVVGEWPKLTAIAVFVVGFCVAAYLANRP